MNAARLPKSVGHVFYEKLDDLLREAGFDRWVEDLCAPHYADNRGRPSIPPGTYFRMLLVGYFEGLDSQRGIAWRCADSLSLRKFLGLAIGEETPDHSSLSVIRRRLPTQTHEAMFQWVLGLARVKKLLGAGAVKLGVDSTYLEANAAMKSIVRKDTGDDWKQYVKRLMVEAGEITEEDDPPDDELRKFDRKRTDKQVSNAQWKSDTDEDSRIMRMKDGRTHLAYKAEHAVDLDSGLILAAEVYYADEGDPRTLEDSVHTAQVNLTAAGGGQIRDVAVDKGYYSGAVLETFAEETDYRLYASEKTLPEGRHHRWQGKSAARCRAVRNNARRAKGKRGRAMQRKRSEVVERTFAHTCETGGGRRTWLRGAQKVQKRHWLTAAAHNLGCLMRSLFGMGTPRGLQQFNLEWLVRCLALLTAWMALGTNRFAAARLGTRLGRPRFAPAFAVTGGTG